MEPSLTYQNPHAYYIHMVRIALIQQYLCVPSFTYQNPRAYYTHMVRMALTPQYLCGAFFYLSKSTYALYLGGDSGLDPTIFLCGAFFVFMKCIMINLS